MSPKISVLMCVHNGMPYLEESVQSVLNQDFKDFEFIVVENCSTDRSFEFLSGIDDSRIKVFQTNLKQLSFNLNFGLSKCEAPLIARMDADDIAHKTRLANQYKFFIENPETVVLGTQTKLFNESGFTNIERVPESNSSIRKNMPFRKVFLHPTVMFRRQDIMDVGGYLGGQYGQDFDLWLRLARNPELKFANLPEAYLDYRVHSHQARGRKEAYALSAGYLFREFLLSGAFSYLAGSLTFAFKGLLWGR